jgi:hypothetical protein
MAGHLPHPLKTAGRRGRTKASGGSGWSVKPATAWLMARIPAWSAMNRRADASAPCRQTTFTNLAAVERIAGPNWWQQEDQPWSARALPGEIAEGLGQVRPALAAYDEALKLVESDLRQLCATRPGHGGSRPQLEQVAPVMVMSLDGRASPRSAG